MIDSGSDQDLDAGPRAPIGLAIQERPERGRGVFARRPFRSGEVLERAPVLVVPRATVAPLRGTLLDDYWFWWDEDHNACGLGWASLYNHGCPANATFQIDSARRWITFVAVVDIAPGAEVTINYHGDPANQAPVWFRTS
ncbi:MAG: SET domain-containing protein-lysine N-methyltransferase [Planctomycetota bacterium]